MVVRSNSNHTKVEQEGDTELVLTAITYTGNRSLFSSQNMIDMGGYPSLDAFNNSDDPEEDGETKIVYIPTESLGWWETHSNFRIEYSPEAIARGLLSRNFIGEQIVGPGYDPKVRADLEEHLDLTPFRDEDELREQLYDIAGYSDDEEDEAEGARPEEPDTRLRTLMSDYDRSVLIKAANSYEDLDELLEDNEVSSVSHLSQSALAEFLASKPNDEVNRRLSTLDAGGAL